MKTNYRIQPARRTLLAAPLFALLAATTGLAQEAAPPALVEDDESDVVMLSPFVVTVTNDHGYYAENTLAGSRLNAKISDLAPSISVITKQLLEDTASTDLNDVFRYEINTEGSSTYTPATASFRSDGVVDVNSGAAIAGTDVQTNATANRIRGLGTPTTGLNYYPSIPRVPADAYNLASIEINRGPNSMLFGMGSPAGVVNFSTQAAIRSQDFNKVSLRLDSHGSARGSFAFNRALIKDKLALYGAYLADERRFERRPSYDNTRRLYGAISARPFSGTTLSANVEWYRNENRRPNTLTPRDFVTEWKKAGSPVYDSQTRTITTADGTVQGVNVINASSPFAQSVRDFVLAQPDFDPAKWNATANTYNGVSIFGPAAYTNTASILYTRGIANVNQARPLMQITGGELVNWFQPTYGRRSITEWGGANFPLMADIWSSQTASAVYNRDYTASTGWSAPATVATTAYRYAGVSDRAIYDWEKVNINQMNFGSDRNMTYNVELEQKLRDDLYFSAGWFRQDFRSLSSYTVSQLQVATLYVDTNKYLPNGSVNPLLGKVYVDDQDPDRSRTEIVADSYRAMLAYTPDFTRNRGWSRWLGRHQVLGMWSRDETLTSSFRERLQFVASTSADGRFRYMNNPQLAGWNYEGASVRRQYYLAGPGEADATVVRSSGEWNYDSYTGDIAVYDYATGQFKPVTMTTAYNVHSSGTGRNDRIVDTLVGGLSSQLWNDRLVTTFGLRRDEVRTRSSSDGRIDYADGSSLPEMTPAQKWVDGAYQYDEAFRRWKEWSRHGENTTTLGGVLKPFNGWGTIERRADRGSLLWQFVRDLGFSYNRSNNFNPPSASYVDAFGQSLAAPVGEGEDYGFQFALFNNKLFARVVWFTATNENELANPGSSLSRLTSNIDTNLFRNWARSIAMINLGMDPTSSTFGTNLTANEELAVEAAAAAIWGQEYDYYDNLKGEIYATRTSEAKGVEVQLNYNPTPGWTMRVTAGKQDTKYKDVLKEFDAWHGHRSTVWDEARASDYLLPQYQAYATPYTTEGGRAVFLGTFWSAYGYRPEVGLDQVNGYYNTRLYYNGLVHPQYLLMRDLDGQNAPGQRRYRVSYMTNYVFGSGRLKGFGLGGSQRWEDKAVIGYLGKASGANGPLLDISDTTRPVFDSANWYTDLWVSYSRRIFRDKVGMKLQLNVDNVFEGGGLRATAVNLDGSPYAYRIIDSRLFKFTTSFDF